MEKESGEEAMGKRTKSNKIGVITRAWGGATMETAACAGGCCAASQYN